MSEPENDVLMTIDRALEAGAVTSDDALERELQELALVLAADISEPAPAFTRELDARVRDGFPRRRRLPRIALRRPPMPVLAAAASALVALAVVVSLTGKDSPDSVNNTSLSGPASDAQQATPKSAAPSDTIEAVPPVGGGSGFEPGADRRRIERSASITLAAPEDKLDDVADDVAAITDRRDGFVLRSSLSTGDDGAAGGSFELRIPAAQLRPALRELGRLGEVRSRNQSGQDITRDYATAGDRLQGARTERKGLLRRLARGGTDTQIEATRRRLDLNAGEIRTLRGQRRALRLRSDYASVSVTLQRKGDDSGGATTGPGSGDGLGGAVDDAVGSLSDAVEITVRALGVGIPLALAAGVLWLGAAALRRRRREGALSA
jgi:Domain of unknown function (DUF4349)